MRGGTLGVGRGMDSALLLWPEARIEVAASARRRLCVCGPDRAAGAPLVRGTLGAFPSPEEGSCPSCCSMPPVAVARPPPCRSFTPAGRRATRGSATPPIRRRPRRSSPSCAAGDHLHGLRLRGLLVVLWRAGLRINEALALAEADLDGRRGSLLVRRGKGGRPREVGMDDWAWEQLEPWLQARLELPVGPLFCIINGPTRGRPWTAGAAARSCAASPARPACVGASRRTSSGMRMPSRWPARACR